MNNCLSSSNFNQIYFPLLLVHLYRTHFQHYESYVMVSHYLLVRRVELYKNSPYNVTSVGSIRPPECNLSFIQMMKLCSQLCVAPCHLWLTPNRIDTIAFDS